MNQSEEEKEHCFGIKAHIPSIGSRSRKEAYIVSFVIPHHSVNIGTQRVLTNWAVTLIHNKFFLTIFCLHKNYSCLYFIFVRNFFVLSIFLLLHTQPNHILPKMTYNHNIVTIFGLKATMYSPNFNVTAVFTPLINVE